MKKHKRNRVLTVLIATFIIFTSGMGLDIINGESIITEAEALSYTTEEVKVDNLDHDLYLSNVKEFQSFVEQRKEEQRMEEERLAYEAYKKMPIDEKIVYKCEEYGIPSDIVLAIARLETGHFKSKAYTDYNNPGGMSIREVPIKYDTIEEGVEVFISNLANNYFGQGLTTPESIGKKYCPVNYDHWVSLVYQLMY